MKSNRLCKLMTVLLLASTGIGTVACSRGGNPAPTTEVSGKSNGGDTLKMSSEQIKTKLASLKPALTHVFETLGVLNEAEGLLEGSTELAEKKDLRALLTKMTGKSDEEPFVEDKKDVLADIASESNFEVVDKPCLDGEGQKKAAAANAGEFGGRICFSLPLLSQMAPKDADETVDILLIAMAAHEFAHHYLRGDVAGDEALARSLQEFLSEQLHHYGEEQPSDVVSTSVAPYLDLFRSHAETKLQQAKTSTTIRM